jgi:hypothetical protein
MCPTLAGMTSSPLVAAITAAAGAPTDVRAFNTARLELQRFGTPDEVQAAMRVLPDLPRESARWFERLHDYCFWEKSTAEPFVRETDDPEWTLFRNPEGTPGRELVVGFAGSSGNVNHSSPILLQQLDAAQHDLLIVRDLKQKSYMDGAGPASTFDELIERIEEAARPYRSILTIGSSMGGGPALHVGARLGARRAVSLGGGPMKQHDGRRRATSNADPATEVWCVFGEENARDTAKAHELLEGFPAARLLALPGIRDHNVSHEAFLNGRMTPLFQLLLTRSSEHDALGDHAPAGAPMTLQLTASCTPPTWTTERPAPGRRTLPHRVAARLRRAWRRAG